MSHRWTTFGAVTAAAALAVCAGCTASTGSTGSTGGAAPVANGTFRLAITADPGTLNPLASQLGVVQQIGQFLYDPLLHDQNGRLTSGLASSWHESGRTVTFALRQNVACSDGRALTADDVAATVNYVGNAKNASPLLGLTVPPGTKAVARTGGKQLVLTTPQPTGFLLEGLANLPIVCGSPSDTKSLTTKPSGSGPYVLASATPGSEYKLTRRTGYAWGPGGASTDAAGLPKDVTIQVVTNETTAANLLLANSLDAGVVAGPDSKRLKAAGLAEHPASTMYGEFVYNQQVRHSTRSPAIRLALTQALDLAQLRTVATAGTGTAPTRLTGTSPCTQDTVSAALPARDVDKAKAALGALGGHTLTFVYPAKAGSAFAELAVQQWKAAGVNVTARPMPDAQLVSTLYQTGDFDIAAIPIDGQNPIQVMNSFSGPTPAKGGNNFAAIANATYDALSAKAARSLGTSGCADWAKADAALVSAADVVPFAMSDYPTWGRKSTAFSTNYYGVVPMTVRITK